MSSFAVDKIIFYIWSEKFIILISLSCLIHLYIHYLEISKPIVKLLSSDQELVPLKPDVSSNDLDYNISEFKLIDLDFQWLISPNVCNNTSILLLIIVSSSPENFEARTIIRKTWGQNTESVKVVFTLGAVHDKLITRYIADESKEFGDIVKGSFVDHHRNQTYKHMMGLKWAWAHCRARYVLQMRDTSFVNRRVLHRFIIRELSPWGTEDLIACLVIYNAPVMRKYFSNWFVPESVYPLERYPQYCSGQFILYSQNVLPMLIKASETVKYFHIDDVYVTGFLTKRLNVHLHHLEYLFLFQNEYQLLLEYDILPQREFLFTNMVEEDGAAVQNLWAITNPCDIKAK